MTTKQKIYTILAKRPIGFLGALLALILTSPIFLATMVILYIANKNGFKGIFFKQNRPGKKEKIFTVFKFKSMTDEKDSEGNMLSDKERLTKVGEFIRATSIDELPQLINILKGEMAFIGPRPLLVEYLPFYYESELCRHDVTPGISGWAQVNGRNVLEWDDQLALDVYYVKNISLSLDVKIFFKTIVNVFSRKGVMVITGDQKTSKLSQQRERQR